MSLPLVFLHGWAANSASWMPLIDVLGGERECICVDLPGFGAAQALDSCELDDWLDYLERKLPARSVLIGWSLGGMLAAQLAARCPERVAALVTIASNARFVRGGSWKAAMPTNIERDFYRSFVAAPELTLKRFCALEAEGEADVRAARKQLRGLQQQSLESLDARAWAQALDLLAAIDNRSILAELNCSALHLYGAGDALVPAACAAAVAELQPQMQVEVLPSCGHAPHITQVARVASVLVDFLESL